MIDPIVVEFDVEASPQHAFDTWTQRVSWWWPRSHTLTGEPEAIIFEPFAGGRIYEQGTDDDEHEWGEVLVWEPPRRLAYLWHLFFDRSEATEITVTFTENPRGSTVRLVQAGFERLAGDAGPERRRRTSLVWLELTALYQAALQRT